MESLKERLHREIERLNETELRMLYKPIADSSLPEVEPLSEEVAVLDEAETLSDADYLPWQRHPTGIPFGHTASS